MEEFAYFILLLGERYVKTYEEIIENENLKNFTDKYTSIYK